jgi:hypothetical protein
MVLKSTIFWDITPCSPLKVNRRFGFLLGLFFDPEDGGDIFRRNVVDFQRTIRRYIPEDSTLHYLDWFHASEI